MAIAANLPDRAGEGKTGQAKGKGPRAEILNAVPNRKPAKDSGMTEDEREIQDVVKRYITGFNRGSKELLLEVLHPRFISTGFVDGALQWDSAEDFAAFCEHAAPDPEGPIPDWRIETLVISGDTAVTVVHDRWGSRRFRDSLTLLKDQAGWRIVFKAFHGLG